MRTSASAGMGRSWEIGSWISHFPSPSVAWIVILLILVLLPTALLAGRPPARSQLDLRTYYYAGAVYNAGGDPYDLSALAKASRGEVEHSFVYPPYVLPVLGILARTDIGALSKIFLVVKAATMLLLVALWSRWLRSEDRFTFVMFCFIAFGAAVYVDFFVGNISVFEQLLLWLGFLLLLKDRPTSFAILVLLCGLVKLTPLALLAVLPLIGGRRNWLVGLSALIVAIAILISSYILTPSLFIGFLSNLPGLQESGAINPSLAALLNDFAGVFDAWTGVHEWVIGLCYAVAAIAVLLVTLKWARRQLNLDQIAGRKWAVIATCLAYALLAPRMKTYSFMLVILPAFICLSEAAQPALRSVPSHMQRILGLGAFAIFSSISLVAYGHDTLLATVLAYSPLIATAIAWLVMVLGTDRPMRPLPVATSDVVPREVH